jgi:hypothetical protein
MESVICNRKATLKIRVDGRAEGGERTIGRDMGIVKTHQHVRSPLEALLIRKIRGVGILIDEGHAREQTAGFRRVLILLQRATQHRIKAGEKRPEAQRRTHQSIGARAETARSKTGAAGSCAGLGSDAPDAASRSVQHQTDGGAEDGGSGPGAQDIRVGDIQCVARDRDVEIVLQSESDRVIERQVEFAIAQKRIDASGIRQIRRSKMPWHVRTDGIGKM